ncbi:MAG TPA: 3-deoxy-D-manno-octulosonic acid transferase [Caulobacteraceae bacterium]|nr:3-deoxy-D-manno-octulosonic acid transferase [Caulobacteraceae bacterium]
MRRPASLALYAAAMGAASPLAPWLLKSRAARGKDDPARLGERLGRASRPRPDGRLIWLHGASVGEGLALLPLVERLSGLAPDATLLVTSGTRTSAEVLGARLPAGAIHQYVPLDTPAAAARFMSHWRPNLAVFVESELWPNLIAAARGSGARLALVSARMSEASLAGWRRAPAAAAAVLSSFDLILAKDRAALARFESLGGQVAGLWDAKLGAPPLCADETELAALKEALSGRTVLLAASTHAGEEEIVLEAFARAASDRRDALLIVAPRHPARGAEVEALVEAARLAIARRSAGGDPASARVYVADTLGELGLFFRLARLAFIGGSLIHGVGGHNPLEPARLGCAVAAGPHTDHWPVYGAFQQADAVRMVTDAAELATLFGEAMADDPRALAERGQDLAARLDADNAAVAPRLLALVAP